MQQEVEQTRNQHLEMEITLSESKNRPLDERYREMMYDLSELLSHHSTSMSFNRVNIEILFEDLKQKIKDLQSSNLVLKDHSMKQDELKGKMLTTIRNLNDDIVLYLARIEELEAYIPDDQQDGDKTLKSLTDMPITKQAQFRRLQFDMFEKEKELLELEMRCLQADRSASIILNGEQTKEIDTYEQEADGMISEETSILTEY
jgi:hypothetical protein